MLEAMLEAGLLMAEIIGLSYRVGRTLILSRTTYSNLNNSFFQEKKYQKQRLSYMIAKYVVWNNNYVIFESSSYFSP